jgi:hypothetical protein
MTGKRTVMTLEKMERYYYYPPSNPVTFLCEQCREEVAWITPDQASALSRLTLRELFRSIETAAVHFIENATGEIRVCLNSIAQPKEEE